METKLDSAVNSVKSYSRTFAYAEMSSIKKEVDARIAELAAEVAREKESVAQYQQANLELSERLRGRDGEVARLREALADVAKESWNIDTEQGDKIREAIRNALREG